ncbi:hypothetical protein DL93DRAFT_2047443, partial [Clavulina sp. PMI_390]
MPLPGSDGAPRFRGKHLRAFLDDYNMATTSAGWSDSEKCDHLPKYVSHANREIVLKMKPRLDKDWVGTEKRMKELFSMGDEKERFTQDSINRFTRKSRSIRSKKEYAAFYREFTRRADNLKTSEAMSPGEKNKYFWKGLPSPLRQSILLRLHSQNPHMNIRAAPDVDEVHKAALSILDKDSLLFETIGFLGTENTSDSDSDNSDGSESDSESDDSD